jgi:uncharacterized protein (TIGR02270 family)
MGTNTQLFDHALNSYTHLYEKYFDDASFLWVLRNNSINKFNYNWQEIKELDKRIDSQIDALLTSPDESWTICLSSLQLFQPGEVFVSSILAFRSLDIRKIQIAVEAGLTDHCTFEALTAAMSWLPDRYIHSWIKKFLSSKNLEHKYLALAVCGSRREDPREYLTHILNRADCLCHENLYARGLRLIGEIKRFDLIPILKRAAENENEVIKFWSIWSQILLGDRSKALLLKNWITDPNPLQLQAVNICFRVIPIDLARDWIVTLSKNPLNQRVVIQTTAILGDPEAIPWLLAKMHNPVFSRIAGEAFTTITGIDLKEHNLILENIPKLENILPDNDIEDISDNIDDGNLEFPDVNKLAALWQKYQTRFLVGNRYFFGKIINDNAETLTHLRKIFINGNQKIREAAALELSLLNDSQYLLNHKEKINYDDKN